ncbi:hypothetical protein MCEMAEM19_00098 [Candidatus Pelagibacterales bacterium]
MRKIVTLKTGNTSWWKNIKYRREAATDLKKYRKLGLKILKIKTYRLQGANSLIYSDYQLSKLQD